MTNRTIGIGAFGPEPAHDPELGALLRTVIDDAPMDSVNWAQLAARIGQQVAAQAAAPWWAYAARWERRVIPIAIAAGISAAAALFTTTASASEVPRTSASALATEVASGTPVEDAAALFARSITSAVDLTAAESE
ncbi:MAG: hypothetical protein M3Z05_14985 [Gemmatimonadota bacterium]|nr:hypothetical protein [Gemmatimonadota bacterium]